MDDALDSHDADTDFEPASTHLEADIVARRGSTAVKTARTLANLALGLVTGDSGLSTTDLVVTRRETSGEILRVPAGSIVEADQLLLRVRVDLDTKTVSEFLGEWRVLDE